MNKTLLILALLLSALTFGQAKKSEPTSEQVTKYARSNRVDSAYLTSFIDVFYDMIEDYGVGVDAQDRVSIQFTSFGSVTEIKGYAGYASGMNIDNVIEIYIDADAFMAYDKPAQYALVFHELFHDVLNVEHDNSSYGLMTAKDGMPKTMDAMWLIVEGEFETYIENNY